MMIISSYNILFYSETEFMASAYEDGSDTSEGSTGTGNLASVGASALATLPAARVSSRPRLRITGPLTFIKRSL